MRPWPQALALAALVTALSLLPAGAVRAQEPDRSRHPMADAASTQAMEAYKANRVPMEYLPFRDTGWEFIDLGVLLALLASGTWMVFRRVRTRWMLLQLSLSLLYFGFWRGGCICPVGATASFSRAMVHPDQIGRVTLALFLAPLVAALVAGRVFCGSVCPLGAVQQLILPRSRPWAVPRWLDRALSVAPVLVLGLTAWLAIRGTVCLVCRLDPFVTGFAFGHAGIRKLLSQWGLVFCEPGTVLVGDAASWAWLCGTLVLCVFVALPFCRYVCPYGVLLGLFSLFAFKPWSGPSDRCVGCGTCGKACPTQAIAVDREQRLAIRSRYTCVECGRCKEACKRNAR